MKTVEKIEFIPFMCPLLEREIDFGYCTEIEYVAMGLVNADFLVDGDDISSELAAEYCTECSAKKNSSVRAILLSSVT